MDERIIVLGNDLGTITELLHEIMESDEVSAAAEVILTDEDENPEPIFQYIIEKMDEEKPIFEKAEPKRDWKKFGAPKKWKMK